MISLFKRFRDRVRPVRSRVTQPVLEGLEGRLLLYATSGNAWANPIRVTYSFMPDGTNVGGSPSSLFSTMNQYQSTATWEGLLAKAAAAWEQQANVNLVQVSDDGVADGSGSYVQGDPNMGDIRIGAIPLPAGDLASTFLLPPTGNSSASGDIMFNSNVSWSPSTGYDLLTVALHEMGHALGMDHSTVTTAEMYGTYNSVKPALTSDDIAGIQSIYGAPVVGPNASYTSATAIALNGSAQAVVTGLDIASASNTNWFTVTVPSNTSGTLAVTMQSSSLSSLEPKLTLYDSGLHGLAAAGATTYGGTATVTLTGVTAGQTYYIKASADVNGPGAAGAYGLNVNAGTGTMSAIAPPNTSVLASTPSTQTVEYLQAAAPLDKTVTIPQHKPHTDSHPNGVGNHLKSSVEVSVAGRPHVHSAGRELGHPTHGTSRHAS